MDFQISALAAEEFAQLFGQNEATLAQAGIKRMIADTRPGFPCRVSLREAEVGEPVLLLNYEHLQGASPYRSRHAIFVREGAETAVLPANDIPESLRIRLLSVRAFSIEDMLVDADVVHGSELDDTMVRMLGNPGASYLHIHNAKPGCYAARVDRC